MLGQIGLTVLIQIICVHLPLTISYASKLNTSNHIGMVLKHTYWRSVSPSPYWKSRDLESTFAGATVHLIDQFRHLGIAMVGFSYRKLHDTDPWLCNRYDKTQYANCLARMACEYFQAIEIDALFRGLRIWVCNSWGQQPAWTIVKLDVWRTWLFIGTS